MIILADEAIFDAVKPRIINRRKFYYKFISKVVPYGIKYESETYHRFHNRILPLFIKVILSDVDDFVLKIIWYFMFMIAVFTYGCLLTIIFYTLAKLLHLCQKTYYRRKRDQDIVNMITGGYGYYGYGYYNYYRGYYRGMNNTFIILVNMANTFIILIYEIKDMIKFIYNIKKGDININIQYTKIRQDKQDKKDSVKNSIKNILDIKRDKR